MHLHRYCVLRLLPTADTDMLLSAVYFVGLQLGGWEGRCIYSDDLGLLKWKESNSSAFLLDEWAKRRAPSIAMTLLQCMILICICAVCSYTVCTYTVRMYLYDMCLYNMYLYSISRTGWFLVIYICCPANHLTLCSWQHLCPW